MYLKQMGVSLTELSDTSKVYVPPSCKSKVTALVPKSSNLYLLPLSLTTFTDKFLLLIHLLTNSTIQNLHYYHCNLNYYLIKPSEATVKVPMSAFDCAVPLGGT